jgi:hypothetical protein
MPGQPSAKVENSRCNLLRSQEYEIHNGIDTLETGKRLYPFRGTYNSMIPRFSAMVTACVRSFAPSFARIFLMWLLTVSSAINS